MRPYVMPRNYYVTVALLLIMLCSLASCSLNSEASRAAKAGFNLVLLDDLVRSSIYYVKHKQGMLPSGHINVIAVLGNIQETSELAIDWRVVFYDRSGFELEQTEWNTDIISPEQTITLKTQSINATEAYGYTFYVRSAQN